MTLAAAYKIGRTPALLSDVLVSGPARGKGHIPIPTRVDLNEPLPTDWLVEVTGLYRKSLVVADNLAVAVAGSGLGAALVVRTLAATFKDRAPTASSLSLALGDCTDAMTAATECALVGWIIEADAARSFHWRSTTPGKIAWDQDFVIGTGADLFQSIAWSGHQGDLTFADAFDGPQHYALMQIASLLVNELSGGQPIQNLFGGGYDLLIWDGTRFRYGSGVSFLFLAMDQLNAMFRGETAAAPIVLRQAEVEDCLALRVLLAENQLETRFDQRERAAVIAPLTSLGRPHALSRPYNWNDVPLIADRLFVVIVGTGPDGAPEHWSAGVLGPDAAMFKIEEVETTGRVRFYLPANIIESMASAAQQQFQRR